MLFKLSLKNIRKSIKDYSIYFFTLVVGVIIFYIFNSLETQESMLILNESKADIIKSLVQVLSYVSVFVSIILGFLIVYSNSFLIKRRKKEFGLYLTLGMSKPKVSSVLVTETLIVGILSLIVGLFLGVFASQFLSIFTAKLFEANMGEFQFAFSSAAILKTLLYFGIIFILVMVFNIISISRYKLIDLLTASKKNEKVKFRNKYVVTIAFILSILLLGYAYYLLFNGVLFQFDTKVIYMLISGVLGTFLLFFSISGFFLRIFERIKKSYYKNLNMFVSKQINSKINTTVVSTTVITMMLLLTIGILSGSLSLVNVYNEGLTDNNKTDFTLISNEYNCVVQNQQEGCIFQEVNTNLGEIVKSNSFVENVEDYVFYTFYSQDDITMDKFMDKKTKEDLLKQYGSNITLDGKVDIMSLSEYNKIMDLYNEDKISLQNNQYLLTANQEKAIEFYKKQYASGYKINVNKFDLVPASKEIKSVGFQNYSGASNFGTLIVPDQVVKDLYSDNNYAIGNYKNKNKNEGEEKFLNDIRSLGTTITYRTKIGMADATIGIKAICTFVGLYLGIIFAISSATVLAIGQLSESSDNKNRYKILRQIGADEKMIKRALFAQISIAFLLPLVVALIHAFFGLRELNGTIELIGNIDLTSNIILTTIFIVVVYGGYFLATYLCSKNIIKEN